MTTKLSICAVAMAIAIGFSVASAQQAAPAGNAEKGKDLFVKYTCYGCHGFSAQNGPAGNRLNPMTMTVTGFIGLVRNPGAPNRMPSYSAKTISDQQLTDIWTYIKTLPNAPAAKDIPLLQQIKTEATK
jgi:mono/diheme cytochrome c family protein